MLEERKRMVENLVARGHIKTEKVKKAMEKVPREKFVPADQKMSAYLDQPLPIGEGQTISAPHMVAMMCEALDLERGMKVLEVGTGCGYHAAVVAEIVGEEGKVYTIERIESLYKRAKEKLKDYKQIKVIHADGTEGWEEAAPYDRIYVTAAAPEVPEPLKKQLKVGGKLLVPVGRDRFYQDLILLEKLSEDNFKTKSLGGVAFVPLIGKYGWHF
ncbi:MAG TPA: protein-L-isoaspartate O-methyltransferase [Methanothermobacter sp.]|nr:protein-L-isoaspartate O-methyltransferase [Methanothermobacter sp. MT-2]HHW05287.1 protein-L-isoaspartate O-methyltransferase [Methanothermobacter sp.]HOK72899.1 protein-L-isoaspartate O-methyltransferase [Methanothermobacter sp.]HOL69015.1 protein-L-isoaspartate O-methyltransferase [Methanothermobacter sp.]HPQ04848.1 protein-L-isoaspartate O-methyltransferase [Methanothermobacter sp.]